MMAQGVYRIPEIAYDVAVAVTNTTPMGAFRGAGRPEAAAFLERIVDMAADELGIDPVEMRRRNFLQPDEFPYATLMGADVRQRSTTRPRSTTPCALARLRRRCGPSRPSGGRRDTACQLGIGVCTYVEITGGERYGVRRGRGARRRDGDRPRRHVRPRAGPRHGVRHDRRRPARRPDGAHPLRPVRHRARPTRRRHGRLAVAADRRHCRARAADGCAAGRRPRELAAEPARGRDRTTSWSRGRPARRRRRSGTGALVGRARGRRRRRRRPARGRSSTSTSRAPTFPFGAHVAVVEVDTETGRVELRPPRRRRRLRPGPQPAARGRPAARRHRPGRRRRRSTSSSSTTRTATR